MSFESGTQSVRVAVAPARIGVDATVGDRLELGVVIPGLFQHLKDDAAIADDIVAGLRGGEGRTLLEADVDELEIADVLGKDDALGTYRVMGYMV